MDAFQYHRLGSLKNRNLFAHSFEGWKSKIKMPAWWGSGENSSWPAVSFMLYPYMAEIGSSGVSSFSYKGTSPIMGASAS